MRPFIFAANWKLFKTEPEAQSFCESLLSELPVSLQKNTVIFPTAFLIPILRDGLQQSHVTFGAQNICAQTEGAFTGENSAVCLKAFGGKWALIGHSERRSLYGEGNALLRDKVLTAQSEGLHPVYCIGETLEEREGGKLESVIREQLTIGLEKAIAGKPLTIAYEPVWAIGTGKVATVSEVAETHAFVRKVLVEILGDVAEEVGVLYGGSVKPDNAKELSAVETVDGFLIGGASLKVESFVQITEAAAARV